MTRRQRLKNILGSFGHDTVRYHAQAMMYRALNNLDRVPVEILEGLASEVVRDHRFGQKLARQNRARRAATPEPQSTTDTPTSAT